VRPAGPVEAIGKQMAGQFVGDVRAVGIRLRNLTRLIADTVTAHGTRLPHGRRCRAGRGSSADRGGPGGPGGPGELVEPDGAHRNSGSDGEPTDAH
jgi:hypothetical protein